MQRRHVLEALIGCAGVTLAAVATAMRITLNKAEITAAGDLDFRGTMGVDAGVSVGFENLRLHFDLDTDALRNPRKSLFLSQRNIVLSIKHYPNKTLLQLQRGLNNWNLI